MGSEFWFKFNFKDWANDVKPLSLHSRGLLIELIIYMRSHSGEMPVDIPLIVRLTGGLTEQITESLSEFKTFGTFDFEKTDAGEKMISRRIKRDICKSLTNKENGKKGGSPILKSLNRTDKGEVIQTPNSNSYSYLDKGGVGEKDFDPTLASKLLEQYSSETLWMEQVTMKIKVSMIERTKELLRRFLEHQSLSQNLVGRSERDIKNHFLNWVNTNPTERDDVMKKIKSETSHLW